MPGSAQEVRMFRTPTFIVSLPDHRIAYDAVVSQLDPEVFEVHAPVGFPGRLMPDSICLKLTRDPNSVNNKGALGCMLSHLRTWETVAKMSEPYALVLEDDV